MGIKARQGVKVDQIKHEESETQQEQALKPAIKVAITQNRLEAYIELSRTSTFTLNPEPCDIKAALKEAGVVYGINEAVIETLSENPSYTDAVLIASGFSEQVGENGYLKYLIEKKKDLKPTVNADGTVDYRNLGLIHNVEPNEALCEVYHPTKGEDGRDVCGNVLEGRMGRDIAIPTGKNTRYDEESKLVLSTASGGVDVDSKGVISVVDILKLNTVDNSTGDIVFNGDVIVNGDVASGFKVDAQGSIVVKGTVEGSKLIAKGDIMVGIAVNGMNTAKIRTEGSLKCKHIQNCNITVGGDIFADSIMHCNIECNGSIELKGKRGAIIGGKALIAYTLTVQTIGTNAHVPTFITMAGGDITLSTRLTETKKRVGALDAELLTTVQTIKWCNELIKKGQELKPFHKNAFEKSKQRLQPIQSERNEILEEINKIQEEINNIDPSKCFIVCTEYIYSGVRIAFGTLIRNVNDSFINSRVCVIDGEISILSQ